MIDLPRARPILLVLLSLLPASAGATALGRPNVFSALGLGTGGAGFAGVANPTTIHYNPAGLVLCRQTVVLGGAALVVVPRQYQPPVGAAEEPTFSLGVVPSFGFSTRFASREGKRPLPIAIGLALYNSWGGGLEFDADAVQPGIISTSMLLFELVPALAYQVTSSLAIGIGLRVGFGLFDLATNKREGVTQAPAELSGFGANVGVSVGATWQPLDWLRVGVVYSSPLDVEMSGDGTVELNPEQWRPDLVTMSAPWPQWAALGLAINVGRDLVLMTGVRWLDWSSMQELFIDFTVISDTRDLMDFTDGVSVHLGAEWSLSQRITLRGGLSYDSNTVPDKAMDRYRMDADKFSVAAGGTFRLWRGLDLDLAYEAVLAPERDVPVRERTEADPIGGADKTVVINPAPGVYSMANHSVALGVRYSY